MQIQEIEISQGDEKHSSKAHIRIGTQEFMLLGSRNSVTVLAGRWCQDRRALGKTFYQRDELVAHYKHGAILAEYADKITSWEPLRGKRN